MADGHPWDEDESEIAEEIASMLFVDGTGLEPEDFLEASKLMRSIWIQTAQSTIDVMRRHVLAPPDRDTALAAFHEAFDEALRADGDGSEPSVRDAAEAGVDAVLETWRGETRDQVKAEGLHEEAQRLLSVYTEQDEARYPTPRTLRNYARNTLLPRARRLSAGIANDPAPAPSSVESAKARRGWRLRTRRSRAT